MQQFGPSAFTR